MRPVCSWRLFGGEIMKRCLVLAGVSAVAIPSAQTVGTVPNGFANTTGNGSFLFMQSAARKYQYLIQGSQLTQFVGMNINGLQWRLLASATSAWPPVNADFANFEVLIGPGVEPAARQ